MARDVHRIGPSGEQTASKLTQSNSLTRQFEIVFVSI
jgi:hypothetical protein